MPNRVIREGFLDSEAVHAISDAAECFYHRLLLAADDAGRMDGRVDILRARLFPLDPSRRASDVEKALSECQQEALVIPYEWDGRRFLQLTKVQRCSPCVTSKYPWKDGTYRITYVKRETRDGEKEFVVTSLGDPMPNPSGRDGDGIAPVIPPISGDGDGDVVGDDKAPLPPDGGALTELVLSAYHEILPRCQRAEALTPKRVKRIAHADKLAKSLCQRQGWEYAAGQFWKAYFEECANDPWMAGDVPNPKNPRWKQNLDVLLAEDRFASIMDAAITAMRGAE